MKPLITLIPNFANTEQCYALDTLLGYFLNVSFEANKCDGEYFEITDINTLKKLTLDTGFFMKTSKAWFKKTN